MSERVNLLGLDRTGLERFFTEIGEKPFRARQLMQWIHQRGVEDFELMTDLSKKLRQKLQQHAELRWPEILVRQDSSDGTRKWLLKVDDKDNSIETVLIPEPDRMTLCISSQVGCTLNCRFCSTARQGFNRNLGTDEIIAQLAIVNRTLAEEGSEQRVTNVVMMGMGEPLLNFEAVSRAMSLMCDDYGYGLSKRRVTLSTAGVVPGIDRLSETNDVSLAVSLHAPNDDLRDQLVPINKKYPIAQLLEACRRYVSGHARRRITFEYVMLKGVNDSDGHARQLSRVLKNVPSKVNLIPFNPFPDSGYECSDQETINRFRQIVHASGIVTVTRKTRGDDIAAACGQLVGEVKDRSRRSARFNVEVEAPKPGAAL